RRHPGTALFPYTTLFRSRVLEREMAAGADHAERLAEIARQRAATESRLAMLQARWEKERDLVAKVRGLRERLEAAVLGNGAGARSEEHTSELQSRENLVC